MNIKTIFTLVKKDISDGLKNMYVASVLVLPIILALLFRFIIPSTSQIKVVIFNPVHSQFVETLRSLPQLKIIDVTDPDSIQKIMVDQKAAGAFSILAGFDEALYSSQSPELTVYLNNKSSTSEQTSFQQIMNAQILSMINTPLPIKLNWNNLGEKSTAVQDSLSMKKWLLLILITTSVLFIGALVVPLLLVEEKEKHTLDFLRSSPVSLSGIVTAKALAGMFYCGLTVIVLPFFTNNVMKNWPLTILVLLLGFLLMVLLGLMIGMLSKDMMNVNTWASLVVILLMIPSFFQSSSGLSPLISTVLHIIPTYYFVDALKMVMLGKTLPEIWVSLLALIAFSIISFSIVVWLLRREKV